MKFLIAVLLVSCVGFSSFAYPLMGNEGAHGGFEDKVAQEFIRMFHLALWRIESDLPELREKIATPEFYQQIKKIQVDSVGRLSDAIVIESRSNRILLRRREWISLSSPLEKKRWALHAVLMFSEIENADDFSISNQYDEPSDR